MGHSIEHDEHTVQGGDGTHKWEGLVYKYRGGKFSVERVTLLDSNGRKIGSIKWTEGTHETLAEAEEQVAKIARDMIG